MGDGESDSYNSHHHMKGHPLRRAEPELAPYGCPPQRKSDVQKNDCSRTDSECESGARCGAKPSVLLRESSLRRGEGKVRSVGALPRQKRRRAHEGCDGGDTKSRRRATGKGRRRSRLLRIRGLRGDRCRPRRSRSVAEELCRTDARLHRSEGRSVAPGIRRWPLRGTRRQRGHTLIRAACRRAYGCGSACAITAFRSGNDCGALA